MILLLAQAAAAAPREITATDQEIAGFFNERFEAAIRDLGIPGGAIVVVRDGRRILAQGHGLADVGSRTPVDVEKTLFRAASISKLLPWLAVMQLAEEGRLDLDQDVNAYLDFKIPAAFGKPITMRNLMTHTAGFPERFHGVFDPDLSKPLGQMLRENVPQRVYAPGSTIAYSNYGAALAGYIVERLRQQPWAQLASERILDSVGMDHSTVLQPVPAALRTNLASTYSYGDQRPAEFRVTPLAPMGSLSPTAGDMGRLLTMLLRDGEGERGRILAPVTLHRMFALQQPLGPELKDGFGLGFLVGDYHGVHYAGHAGNMSTLATDLEILPEQHLGWYYVFNSQGEREGARQFRDQLLHAAIDRFAASPPQPVKAQDPSSAADVAGDWISTRRLAGGPLWFSGVLNTTSVKAEADGGMTIESGGTITHWLPAGHDRFVEPQTGIALAVRRDQSGRAIRLASALLYPAAEFERPPGWVRGMPFVAFFSFATVLLAAIVRPIAAWFDRRRSKDAVPSNRRERSRRWARRSFWIIFVTSLCWGLFGLMLAIDFGNLFAFPAVLRIGLGLLTIATAPLVLIILVDAVLAWRDPSRTVLRRLAATAVAVATAGIAILFYALDVVNLGTNW